MTGTHAHIKRIAIDVIRLDNRTQAREKLRPDTVAQYAELYRVKVAVDLPPPDVFFDGEAHWLADGFHRVNGAKEAGRERISVNLHQGTLLDAIEFAASANASHDKSGMRRTNADKRRSVEMLLATEKWAGNSDRAVAEQCGVDPKTVASVRSELRKFYTSPAPQTRTGSDGKQYPATKPKKTRGKAAAKQPAHQPESDPNASTGDPQLDEDIAAYLGKQRGGQAIEPKLKLVAHEEGAFSPEQVCSEVIDVLSRAIMDWPESEPMTPLIDAIEYQLQIAKEDNDKKARAAQWAKAKTSSKL